MNTYIIQSFDKASSVWFPIAKTGKRYYRVQLKTQAAQYNSFAKALTVFIKLKLNNRYKWLGKIRIIK